MLKRRFNDLAVLSIFLGLINSSCSIFLMRTSNTTTTVTTSGTFASLLFESEIPSSKWFNPDAFEITSYGNPVDTQLYDVDNDGDLDLFAAQNAEGVQLWLNEGSGNFTLGDSDATAVTINNGIDMIRATDFDGDGNEDIILYTSIGGNIAIYFGDGSGGLGDLYTSTGYGSPNGTGIAVADFDGDTEEDLALIAGDDVILCPGLGGARGVTAAGGCSVIANFGGDTPVSLQTALLDGDGNYDLVLGLSGDDSIQVLLGDGAGNFPTSNNFPMNAGITPTWLSIGEVSGDANLDILVASYNDGGFDVFHADDGSATSYTVQPTIITPSTKFRGLYSSSRYGRRYGK